MNSGSHRGFTIVTIITLLFAPIFVHHHWAYRLVSWTSDTHTEMESGEKRYFAVPCSRKTGTNTMQMHKVDRTVGTPTSPAPLMIA